MQAVEVTGKSLEEAKSMAAAKLGVEVDALNVTVLEESKGLFGKMNVRIKAEVGADQPEPKEKKPAKKSTGSRKKAPAKKEETAEESDKAVVTVESEEEKVDTSSESEESTEQVEVVATKENGEQVLAVLENLLDIAELKATAKVTGLNGRYVVIELDGKDLAFLIGKHGEVLNAMQYLTNIIISRQFENGVRVTLDGNNYRQRREEALTKLATDIATEVKNRGQEAVLEALPAFERRIVHKALADHAGITTYSEGEEPARCVVIAPAE